jgi:exonuclease III
MRLTTWNCCRKFDQKLSAILSDTPDIAVIQECSAISLQKLPVGYRGQWLHGAKNQGLGMIYREPYAVTDLAISELSSFGRVDFDGPTSFRLIAIWNCPPKGTKYTSHLHNFLDVHEDWFDHETILLTGDLNSQDGASFDKGRQKHSDFAYRLKNKHLHDAYAVPRTSDQNSVQREPTYYHRRSVDAPFHLDYIFGSEDLLQQAEKIEVGPLSKWLTLSDHLPVTLSLAD